MCGSVIEAVREFAQDVLGTASADRTGMPDPENDLFASVDGEFSADAGLSEAPLEDMAGDLFGDVSAATVTLEPDRDTLSGFDASSGLTEAGQIVIPEGYSPPAFLVEVSELLGNAGLAELDPSQLIKERDFDIASAHDMGLDQAFEPGWTGAPDTGDPAVFDTIQTGPERY